MKQKFKVDDKVKIIKGEFKGEVALVTSVIRVGLVV